MNLTKSNWTKKDYAEYINYLKEIGESSYANFHRRLTTTKYHILGVRVPKMRSVAKEIFKGNYQSFLIHTGSTYYEEVFIEGMVIEATTNMDLIHNHIAKIDNWALCDSFSLKFVTKDPANYFEFFVCLAKETREYYVRFALIMFLAHYTNETYINQVIKLVDAIILEDYYVKMGIAWLLCECYIKVPIATEAYLVNKNNLNDWTFNKTISKIRESYRVSKDKKDYLNTLKRK